ncbi:Serine/threonine-protein phosphatase 7 long form-like [Vitis vinifera]|uniref:Serine/threonine-protein phosphatase 7 long form-like n=1 Tax=Vitis vinifera TaxID=29760 RepID=A0A438JEZ6_VITVI|nr:Serine/threonine-protein phosphatase 7 long form-like [Vitis vinifera]
MLSMIFRYPILMSIGNGNINYIQLPIKDDDDVRLMFHVVAQIPPSNTIEMYLQTRPRDHSFELSPSFDQEIMGHDVEIPAKGNSAVQIDEMDENLAHNDEMGGNLALDEINEMHYDDEPPTNKVSSDDGEHIMPSPMFKQLNWDAINSMTAEPLTPRTGLWNESNELFKGLRFEKPQLWAVRCKKWQEGCNWRLRACRRKSHGMFEINQVRRRIWEAKRKAMLRVFGDWDESYQHCRSGMNILQLTNPGTKVVWKTIPLGGFLGTCGLCVFFGHLGQVLKGSNIADQLYKLMEESQDSWSWFLIALRHHVTQREGICLISDRHAGINAAVRNPSVGWSPPHAQHRYCLRHVDIGMGWMTTNIAECINGVLKGARMLPIIALVQLTFYRCVSYFETRRAEIRARIAVGDVYTAYAIEKFRRAEAKASGHTVTIFHRIHETFEVITALHGFHMDKGRNKQVVKLNEGTCSCNKWQSFGIPCSHVLAVSAHMRIDSWQLVEKYYRLDAYASCYAPEFNPIPHESYWPYPDFPILHPDPTSMRDKGRPRSSRIRNEMDLKETSVRIRCGLCKIAGHNRRNCPTKDGGQSSNPFLMTIKVSPHDGAGTLDPTVFTWTGHTQVIWQHGQVLTRRSFIVDDVRRSSIAPVLLDGRIIPLLQQAGFYGGVHDYTIGYCHVDWTTRLTPGDTDIDGQRFILTWLSQSFPTLAPDADEESIQRYTRAYILQLIGGIVGLWVWERFPFIAPHRLRIAPHDDQLPPPPLAIRWRDEFQTTSISMHVLAQYRHHLDRLTADQIIWQPYVDDMNVGLPDYCTAWERYMFGFRQGIPQPCDNESILHKCDLRGRHDVDWTTRHGDYIRVGALGTTSIHQIYDIAPPDDFRIRRLCTTVLEAIHEMDRLDAPFSVDATTQLQPPSGDVRPTRRGPRTREIRHTPAVARVRPSTDISPPPHQQPTSSITRSGGVRTKGGGPHTRSSPPPHQQPISSITRSGGGVRTRGGGPHTRSSPPPHQQPISPITRSGGVRTRGRGAHTRGTRHTSILRDAPSTDISLPPVQETPITPMEVPSTPPVVPLVASSPPSIEATLVHEELVHIANDDQQGQKTNRGRGHGRGRGRRHGRGAHGGLHVNP